MQARNSNNAQGIDVSRYQGNIDWKKVAADGISFAFIKASEGKTYRDPNFKANTVGAKAAGVLIGAYHFLTATNPGEARQEASNLVSAMEDAGVIDLFDLPPVMDYENNPTGLNRSQINDVAEAFLVELESLSGRRPIVYTGNSFASNFSPVLSAYPLWIARYSTQAPNDVPAWGKWTFWQYSDGSVGGTRQGGGRKVSGIAEAVDLNEYAGTVEQLRQQFGGGKEVVDKDINEVSPWAAAAWEEMKKNGYFDGTRPGAPITREEAAVVFNRLRGNFLKLIAGNTADISSLDKRLREIEAKG